MEGNGCAGGMSRGFKVKAAACGGGDSCSPFEEIL